VDLPEGGEGATPAAPTGDGQPQTALPLELGPGKRAKRSAQPSKPESDAAILAVFQAHRAAWRERGASGVEPKLTQDRRKVIRARLGEGYTVETLVAAAQGIFRSEWHVENGTAVLTFALRNGEAVERFAKEMPASRPARSRTIVAPPPPAPAFLGGQRA
jgi:hypothetical protein